MAKKNPISTDVKKCARCGKNHFDLLFVALTNPQDGYEYFTMCPETNEPVLLRAVASSDGIKKDKNPRSAAVDGRKFDGVSRQDFEKFCRNYPGILRATRYAGEPPVVVYHDPLKGFGFRPIVAQVVFNELMGEHPEFAGKENEYRIYEK